MLRAFTLALMTSAASASPLIVDYNLRVTSTSVHNDRIGNSRFFSGPNTDLVRVSAFVSPSPDSGFYVSTGPDGRDYLAGNGSLTTADISHSATGLQRNLRFVGLTSGFGGGRNEYTTGMNRANIAANILEAWDQTPFTLTVKNPRSPNTQEVILPAADYDRTALPGFVRNVGLTGGGLNPLLEWQLPADASRLTNASIQVRRIDAESPDGKKITHATLVHHAALDLQASSYRFDQRFSNANLPGMPDGLEVGKKYEISVQMDIVDNGVLKGRSRTFFEMTPLSSGDSQVKVFLPSIGPDGVFKFDVEVKQGEKIAIDPVVAIGYEYAIGQGDPLFRSVVLPDVGDGWYDLWLDDGQGGYLFGTTLQAGTEYFFGNLGARRFKVLGIETSAMLDPGNASAFVTQLTFSGDGRFTGTMTPITVEIPEPSSVLLVLSALLALSARSAATRAHS